MIPKANASGGNHTLDVQTTSMIIHEWAMAVLARHRHHSFWDHFLEHDGIISVIDCVYLPWAEPDLISFLFIYSTLSTDVCMVGWTPSSFAINCWARWVKSSSVSSSSCVIGERALKERVTIQLTFHGLSYVTMELDRRMTYKNDLWTIIHKYPLNNSC